MVLPKRLTAALLTAVLALCIYRARTQSFVIDEAWVFERFVNQPLVEMARSWDACNHVLHTLLMKFVREHWGISEHVLRIPTLLGAALYLSAVYASTRLLIAGWRQPLAAALLVLHPLVLDLLVAARGYGLALGLYAWALHCAVSYAVRGWQDKWLTRAGVLAGLSIAANLTFVTPVVALGATLLWMRRGWRVLDWYFGPAFAISTAIVMIPLLQSKREDFYFGEPSLLHTFGRMYTAVLKTEHSVFDRIGWAFAPYAAFAVAALFGWLAIAALRLHWNGDHTHFRQAPFAIVGGTLALCGVIAAVLGLFGVPYPSGRTGLYLILLMTFGAVLLFQHSRAGLVAGVAVCAVYVTQLENRYFVDWRYDAGTRELIRRMDEDRHKRGMEGDVRIGVAPSLKFTAKYYALRRNTPWMQVGDLKDPNPHYVLLDSNRANEAASPAYEIVAAHPASGAVLVRRLP
jgi:MFS family permease